MHLSLTGVEVLALHNALNEIAHGLQDHELPEDLRARRSRARGLLNVTSAIKLEDPLTKARYELELSADQVELGAAAISAALDAMEESEFHARLGVSREEASATVKTLRGHF